MCIRWKSGGVSGLALSLGLFLGIKGDMAFILNSREEHS